MADGSGNVLRLLSWNIDGLDEEDKTERTEEVCRIILLKRPHVVYLQEVVASVTYLRTYEQFMADYT